jgi:hypothetical protein
MTEKRCPHCGVAQPASAFYVDVHGRLSSWCRACVREGNRTRAERDRPPDGTEHDWGLLRRLRATFGTWEADEED